VRARRRRVMRSVSVTPSRHGMDPVWKVKALTAVCLLAVAAVVQDPHCVPPGLPPQHAPAVHLQERQQRRGRRGGVGVGLRVRAPEPRAARSTHIGGSARAQYSAPLTCRACGRRTPLRTPTLRGRASTCTPCAGRRYDSAVVLLRLCACFP
jgi:hypothetical protein